MRSPPRTTSAASTPRARSSPRARRCVQKKSFELVRQQTKSVALTCFSIARLNGQFYRTYHSLCPSQSLSPVLSLSDRFTDPTPSLRTDEWVREKCDPSRSRSHPRSAARRSAPGCIDASLIHVRQTLTIVDRHVFLEQIAKFDEQREENKVSLFLPRLSPWPA